MEPPPVYPVLSTPEQVLTSLQLAYSRRDSSKYFELYDSTYTGSSQDLNVPDNTFDFVYLDEVRHIRTLASTPGVSAFVDLGPTGTWSRLPSDESSHPEWTMIQISGASYRIEVTEGTTSLGAIGEAGTFQQFTFRPKLDLASPTDTLWKIIRWQETGASAPSP